MEVTQLSQQTTTVEPVNSDQARRPASEQTDGTTLLSTILASLDDDQAIDVTTIPLAGKSDMADHMVIASGRSSRQVASISEKLVDRLKHDHAVIARTEGKDTGDWVLLDAGDVIVHVFRPEVREFYALEKMWQPEVKTGRKPAPLA